MTRSENLPKTQHLFLLIGGNPLPNYVAASLLLADKGHLYLVHSKRDDKAMKSGTYEIALRLCEQLHKKFKQENKDFTHCYIAVDEADPEDVYRKVQEYAGKIPRSASVGLNYTGGTKVMAVHTHRVLHEKASSAGWQPIFTYLDAESTSLVKEGRVNDPKDSIFIRQRVGPSIKTLTELYGEKLLDNAPTQAIYLSDCADSLVQMLAKNLSLRDPWNKWVNGIREWKLKSPKKDPVTLEYQNWDDENILRTKQLAWPKDPRLAAVCQLLQSRLGTDEITKPKVDSQLILENARQRAGISSCSDLCDWFDGFWLEHYVLNCIKNIAEQNLVPGLHDYGRNLNTHEKLAHNNFEMDVAAMVGYQLFAFSCTTTIDKNKNQMKFFEAMVRARQLGGDEARVALVSLHPRPDDLRKRMQTAWRIQSPIRVFGQTDLPNLTSELVEWFNLKPRR